MWVVFRRTPSRASAEMWKEFLEAEGIPARVLAEPGEEAAGDGTHHTVYIAKAKQHVVEEMLRNI
ncbi:MAG: hypothetical protein Q7O66_10580 [Dehalococcoidia bacterium]|nr:hypothetical protein [Dehalococcoidia bacterium]